MGLGQGILDRLKIETLVPPQDIGTADVAGTVYIDVSKMRAFLGRADSENLTVGQTLTVQLMQATSAGGAGAKVLGDLATYTAPGTVRGQVVSAQKTIDDCDLAGGFKFVGVRVGSGTNAKVGSGQLILMDRDYPTS